MRFTPNHPEYVPHPLLRDAHVMTIAPAFLPRKFTPDFERCSQRRLFRVEPDVQVLAHCHWQKQRAAVPTLIVLHGLEGSSESSHVIAVAHKAYMAGMNAIRLNIRNCGDTMDLTPTLYNAGLSEDLIKVAEELKAEGAQDIFAAGFSLGGNIVLKTAGELGADGARLFRGVAAVSPAIDLQCAVQAILKPENKLYDFWFLRTLKQKIREKARLFPDRYDVTLLQNVRTLYDFDDLYTAPQGGYGRAANYYNMASSIRVLPDIRIPTLIIASQDDPLVPFSMFERPELANANIHLLSTKYGGHAGFVARQQEAPPIFDNFWAENRIISFCQEVANRQHEVV